MKKLVLFVSVIILSSCALKPIQTPRVATYTLDTKPQKVTQGAPTRKTLLVSIPTASPGYKSARIVYVDKPHQLSVFTRNTWVASPSDMLTPLLVQSLRDTHHFSAVVSPPFTGISDLRLDIHLLRLQQEFIKPHSRLRMALQADLLDHVSNKIIASHRYEIVMPIQHDDPYGGVIAANKATEKLLEALAEFTVRNTHVG